MWEATGRKNLPIHDDASWDGDAARAAIFAWAGYPDDFNPSQAAGGFLLYDTGQDTLESFKDPFALIVEGRLVASQAGLRAAASRLPQTDVPMEARDRARVILDHYQKRMEDERGKETAVRYVWVGSPMNAWRDNDPAVEHQIIPLRLIQDDIQRQAAEIEAGRAKDFGPLQVRHKDELEIGRVLVRGVMPGTRSTLEAGTITDQAVGAMLYEAQTRGKEWRMSHRYRYLMNEKTREYLGIRKFESTLTTPEHAANPRTLFKVYRVPA